MSIASQSSITPGSCEEGVVLEASVEGGSVASCLLVCLAQEPAAVSGCAVLTAPLAGEDLLLSGHVWGFPQLPTPGTAKAVKAASIHRTR